MRWWGWGADGHAPSLPPHALRFLADTLDITPCPSPPVALSRVELAASSIPPQTLSQLCAIVGEGAVRDDHSERVLHAAGKGYPDLVRLRAGAPDGAPDAVVLPSGAAEVAELLALCGRESLAVVPFGGGTSVVGGVAPLAGSHRGVVSLDTGRLADVVELDRESRTVTVGAGLRAPTLERELARHGLTLGHFPQSFEYVSLGGCAATRSAGQASSGYGAIEKMVVGLRMTTPSGEVALAPQPASAAGPSLRQVLVGSEGTVGVISELALRVREAPRSRVYEGVFFEDFATGVEALREPAQ
jgi:alkyldihydroxyacetonephosphate synthase